MTFCFGRELSCEFENWMRSISGLGVERLCLSFICGSVSVPRDPFSDRSLETLSLTAVLLASGQLEGILSSCFNLEQLTLKLCNLPYKLRFSSTVTYVTFHICGGVKEIDFQAANLRALDFHCFDNVRFIFSFVPKLENVTIHPSKADTMSYIFGDFARDLPAHVKSLAVRCGHEIKCIPIDMKMFRNIRQLSLSLFDLYDSDILNISLLLGACPLLQYLNLTAPQVEKKSTKQRGSREPPLSPMCHTKLKEVTLGGFYGSTSEIEVALFILRSALTLERMFLIPGYISPHRGNLATNVSFSDRERYSIQRELHGQAISREAVVIFYK
ncbi:uncharacterized protein LOC132046032 [Lycium ferocissimum]|uniref:uncharacterized protein LOC132046032 n=1 Tax=Lycium ferocissimum TaxID=112874 RepID=UPI002816547A|nr:uncharacterized protein LOC132046032 [Lycium ferocissimum]